MVQGLVTATTGVGFGKGYVEIILRIDGVPAMSIGYFRIALRGCWCDWVTLRLPIASAFGGFPYVADRAHRWTKLALQPALP